MIHPQPVPSAHRLSIFSCPVSLINTKTDPRGGIVLNCVYFEQNLTLARGQWDRCSFLPPGKELLMCFSSFYQDNPFISYVTYHFLPFLEPNFSPLFSLTIAPQRSCTCLVFSSVQERGIFPDPWCFALREALLVSAALQKGLSVLTACTNSFLSMSLQACC